MLLLTPAFVLGSAGISAAETLRLDARALYEKSVSDQVRLSEDGTAVELERGELFEDDGPAAGFSYRPNEEILSGDVRIKKELIIPNPRARSATLLVGPGGALQASVNGKPRTLEERGKEGNYWRAYSFDPSLLQPGKNEIILHGSGKVWIAREDEFAAGSRTRQPHPNRSARSVDGGKNWDDRRLGPGGDIDGEYYVRVFLEHFRPRGSLTLPVLDLGNLAGKPVGPPIAAPGPVRLALRADSGGAARIAVQVRSGSTYVPHDRSWSAWQALGPAGGTLQQPAGRYLQVRLELATSDPLATPRLRQLTVEATPSTVTDWTAGLRVVEQHNEEIVRTSIPFRYEPFRHPKLKALRERYRLEDVVKGAKDELELMLRLAAWSSTWGGAGRENCVGHNRPDPGYPPWDALEILKPMGEGKVWGGFCQQYNLVLLQACESFGIPGRAVSIGAHEVVELWSNQYRKWVHVDGDSTWAIVDGKTGIPLSLWELREAQVRAMIERRPTSDLKAIGPGSAKWTGITGWPGYRYFRLIPRSNFLAEPAPVPLNQGRRGWFWTGHHVWDDPRFPAELLYGHRVRRRGDIEWTLNQARYVLEATERPGELRVHLDTETPGFAAFLAEIDGGGKKPVAPVFRWVLRKGENRLRVLPRNDAGREGIASWIVLHY